MHNFLEKNQTEQERSNIPFGNINVFGQLVNHNTFKMNMSENVSVIGKEGEIITEDDTRDLVNAKNVIIKDGVIGIAENAFAKCQNIEQIEFPDSITELPEKAFMGHKGLRRVKLSETMQVIAPSTFAKCENLQRVEFGSNITQILDLAFNNCRSLQDITLPESIKKIGNGAFSCSGLKYISLPQGVEEVGKGAFSFCTQLIGAGDLPASIKQAGECIFTQCEHLKEVYFEYGTTEIFPYMFLGCTNLKKIELPNTIKKIGDRAFFSCMGLEEIVFPKEVEEIGKSAFCNCRSLTKLVIPKVIKAMDFSVFAECSKLSEVEFKEGTTQILRATFYECINLKKVKLPKTIEKIGQGAFARCENLEEIVFPKEIREIENQAFEDCESLKKVILPGAIKMMGFGVFSSCSQLEEVEFEEGITQIFASTFYKCINLKKVKLPKTIEKIGGAAFFECLSLSQIDLPKGIEKIEGTAFTRCKSLKEIIIPDNVKEIGEAAFGECESLINIVFQGNVEKIEKLAFYNCGKLVPEEIKKQKRDNILDPALRTAVQPVNIKQVGTNAFYNCDSVLNQPIEGIQKIEEEAFLNCKGIKKVELGGDITEIPNLAFKNCEDLYSVKSSNALKRIGNEAFSGCKELISVDLSDDMERIGDYAFLNCRSFGGKVYKNVSSVKEIGEGAFAGCMHLVGSFKDVERIGKDSFLNCTKGKIGISFKNGIEEIPTGAFKNCSALLRVTIPKSVKKIGRLAFCNCKNLKTIKFSKDIKNIEDYAFFGCHSLKKVEPKLSPDVYAASAFKGCEELDIGNSTDPNFNDDNREILDEQFFYGEDESCLNGTTHPLDIEDESQLPLFSGGEPSIDDVQQGHIGDCWLVAALGSLAKVKPEVIKNMIKDNPENGTVSVTLKRKLNDGGFKNEVYTVKKSVFKSKILGGNNSKIASRSQQNIWVQMIEKAFSAYFCKDNAAINLNAIRGRLGVSEEVFKIILGEEGESCKRELLSGDKKDIFENIQESLLHHIPLTMSYYKSEAAPRDIDGDIIQDHHAFSVVGVEKNNEKYCVQLRNPWGVNKNKDGQNKGAVISVDLEEAIRAEFRILSLHKNL